MISRIRLALNGQTFAVRPHTNQRLQGLGRANICNRGSTGRGVQLELSAGLRNLFFVANTKVGRETKTDTFWRFVKAVRLAIVEREGRHPRL